ncbi:MAG: glycosyltransferase [Chitinophagales bacterium]|nr:glycosyltransferase [Chitinophagales bacterium]
MVTNENYKPKVAVFVVTYNHENYIAKALESIVAQKTDFQYKVFIGEDYSTDKTREICLSYKNEYPQIIELILHSQNIGSRNNAQLVYKACFDSGAEYIAMCEGDDYWIDDYKLQKQVDFLDLNPEFSLCFHDVKVLSDEKLDVNPINYSKDVYDIYDIANDNVINTVSVLWRKSMIDGVASYIQISILDYYLYMCLAKKGKIKYIPEVMAVYRLHNTGMWSGKSIEKQYQVKIDLFKSFLKDDFDSKVKDILRERLCDMYATLYKRGKKAYVFNVASIDIQRAVQLVLSEFRR